MGKRSSRYPEHPWRKYAGTTTVVIEEVIVTNNCRRCGKPISRSIQLCDTCKLRFNVWFSDHGYLRFAECASLDMGFDFTSRTVL